MHTPPIYQYHVGSAGWDHADWVGSFYPDDLPPEWRLTYYNNFFTCSYLPYDEWSQQDPATLAQWVEDTLERFRFVLQLRPGGAAPGDAHKLALLAPRTGLLVEEDATPAGLLWIDAEQDLKRMAQRLQALVPSSSPIFIISLDHDLPAMNRVNTLLEVMGF
jgi:hypothetical protein